jgi:hypothetical protein
MDATQYETWLQRVGLCRASDLDGGAHRIRGAYMAATERAVALCDVQHRMELHSFEQHLQAQRAK